MKDSAFQSPLASAVIQENMALKEELHSLRRELASYKLDGSKVASSLTELPQGGTIGWESGFQHTLRSHQIERYSRQLLLGSFGVQGEDRCAACLRPFCVKASFSI